MQKKNQTQGSEHDSAGASPPPDGHPNHEHEQSDHEAYIDHEHGHSGHAAHNEQHLHLSRSQDSLGEPVSHQ